MEYVVNLMDVSVKPGEWAQQREDEGWHVLSVADHFYTDHRPFPTYGLQQLLLHQLRLE